MHSDDSLTRTSGGDKAGLAAAPTRFAPGSVLAGRYTIVALLGRGGMGEVYRADDLKLRQTVALKFLPAAMAADPARLSRFINEVRLARQVTHPNVCRVHDVDEADGLHFISMEYVDGEDLAALLRRIGRLPREKAAEIARQICSGLAAAHERGVLHRDLKPANVMIDGRGRARISDFGLAVAPGEQDARELAGTPAYMAPEQFDGKGASERSDLYALGLLLYELFTGRRAFDAPTVSEMARLHREVAPPEPSAIVHDLEPAVEETILHCLAKDPARRPASAVAVAAELSGGDPLAAMIAAGETPAPELVAAAGSRASMNAGVALALLAVVLVATPLAIALASRLVLLRQTALEMPPDVLRYRADQMLRSFNAPPGEHASSGFAYDDALVDWLARQNSSSSGAPVIRFWYRPASRPIAPPLVGRVTAEDPPLASPGQSVVWLDTRGQLVAMRSLPTAADAGSELDWKVVLAAAGLDASAARAAAPSAIPPAFADLRMAWTVVHPTLHVPVRVEAAAHGGRLVSFQVLGPWAPDPTGSRPADAARRANAALEALFFVVLPVGILLAIRNVRLGRGDRRGAFRLALFAGLARVLAWTLQNGPGALVGDAGLVAAILGRGLYSAGYVWVLYMAIEPSVRRRWPESLISWQRLLAGRWRDARVGRDVLVGVACALGMGFAWAGGRLLPAAWGEAPVPVKAELGMLSGVAPALAYLLLTAIASVVGILFCAVLLLVLRLVLRHAAAAVVVLAVVMVGVAGLAQAGRHLTEAAGAIVALALMLWLTARHGFLSLVVMILVLGGGRLAIPATLDVFAWYGQASLLWMAVLTALSAYGAWAATGAPSVLAAFDPERTRRLGV